MNEKKHLIRKFLLRFFPEKEISDDEDIFALGFLNSLFAMQLVLLLETEFEISLDIDDLCFDNFKSIEAMAVLVDRKQHATPTP